MQLKVGPTLVIMKPRASTSVPRQYVMVKIKIKGVVPERGLVATIPDEVNNFQGSKLVASDCCCALSLFRILAMGV